MRYYPVVRWKMGEQQALERLKINVKEQVTPIIEFSMLGEPRPKEDENLEDAISRQNRGFHNKINAFSKKLLSCWGENEILLDLNSLLNQIHITITVDQLKPLFNNDKCNITPIINPENTSPSLIKYLKELISSKSITTLGFRVNQSTNPQSINLLKNNLTNLAIGVSKCTIVFDLQDVTDTTVVQCKRNFQGLYNDFKDDYNRVIFLSGALTLSSDFGTNSAKIFPRVDWNSWQDIIKSANFNSIQFGDYGIDSAKFVDLPFSGAPKIKYTLADNWIVYKGALARSSNEKNAVQYKKMSKMLVNSNNWRIPNCYGENQILDCSKGIKEIGSPTTWVGIGLNQHITFVVSQLNAMHLLVP